jgi:LIVCS family branched-chain amino acid:cation transporter
MADGIAAAGFEDLVPAMFGQMPLAHQSLGWLLPVLMVLVISALADRLMGRSVATPA